MDRVLLTGADSGLGRRLERFLQESTGVKHVIGVELSARSRSGGGVRLGTRELEHHGFVEFLRDREIDTVIHCSLAADRNGRALEPSSADVIGTMRLCAAVGDPSVPVRALVVASSSSVYPTTSYAPLLQRESGRTEESTIGLPASVLEAEDYARDTAQRSPHLCVSLLRLAELADRDVRGPLSSLLARPVVPKVLGFDPAVQLLHADDAVRALAFAAEVELAGIYNVASEGHVHWSEATRTLRRPVVPLLPLEAGPFQPLLHRVGLPYVPNGLLGLLRFGRALDTAKLAAAGFTPTLDQTACLEALR